MIVRWYPGAKDALRDTAKYIRSRFGDKSSKRFLRDVVRIEGLLQQNPFIGPVELLLSDLPSTYRSIVVNRLNKIVYRIVDDHIEVVDFWDVRREPETLANQVKL